MNKKSIIKIVTVVHGLYNFFVLKKVHCKLVAIELIVASLFLLFGI